MYSKNGQKRSTIFDIIDILDEKVTFGMVDSEVVDHFLSVLPTMENWSAQKVMEKVDIYFVNNPFYDDISSQIANILYDNDKEEAK